MPFLLVMSVPGLATRRDSRPNSFKTPDRVEGQISSATSLF